MVAACPGLPTPEGRDDVTGVCLREGRDSTMRRARPARTLQHPPRRPKDGCTDPGPWTTTLWAWVFHGAALLPRLCVRQHHDKPPWTFYNAS
jgi:hypothetical protein